MFCPNCGNNCVDANFCSNCGMQLRQKTSQPTVGAKPMYNLPTRINTHKGSTDIPTSQGYLGRRGCVVLNDSSVTVVGFLDKRTIIPYAQLSTVIYLRPALNGWREGVLLFRGDENKDVPIPATKDFAVDIASVPFSLDQDTLFYHIFQLLKAVAPATARFEMILPEVKIKKLDEIAQGIDLEYFWDKYAPDRERAVKEICAKHKIKPAAARAMVDKVFDDKQKTLYEADALDAIRDLNFILGNKKKEEQNTRRLKEELRAQREMREISDTLDTIALIKLREMHDD